MRIEMSHLQEQNINFAVFKTDARTRTNSDRDELLRQLTADARRNNLRVDKSALAFEEAGQVRFYGTPDLVKFLSSRGVPRTTHTLDV